MRQQRPSRRRASQSEGLHLQTGCSTAVSSPMPRRKAEPRPYSGTQSRGCSRPGLPHHGCNLNRRPLRWHGSPAQRPGAPRKEAAGHQTARLADHRLPHTQTENPVLGSHATQQPQMAGISGWSPHRYRQVRYCGPSPIETTGECCPLVRDISCRRRNDRSHENPPLRG